MYRQIGFICVTLGLLLVLTLRHEMAIRRFTAAPDSLDPAPSSFAAMALALGTDKVTTHDYQHLYSKYLEPVRHDQLRVLEIGLGCDMPYGPGKSAQVWTKFLPLVELFILEYDQACAKQWAGRAENAGIRLYIGDQANKTLLGHVVAEQGNAGLDMIVDDGGHTMNQQITAFEALWRTVRPGGFYVIEDLTTSYSPKHGGAASPGVRGTTIDYIKSIFDTIQCQDIRKQNEATGFCTESHISDDMASFECFSGICAFRKAAVT